jgi:hypothetical protein
MLTRRLALGALLVFTLAARADDKPKPGAADKPPADAKPAPDAPKADDADKPAQPSKPSGGSSILNPSAGKPSMHTVGQVVIKVTKVDGSTISTKVAEMERNTSAPATGRRSRGGNQTHAVEKDKDYDLASDFKVRWKDLPKKADGKSYTDKEYQAMLEPKGTPGYKADTSDLRSGQTVRLYLSKGSGKDDKVVVTTVMIVTDAPKDADTKNSDTPKKKKKKE